MKKRIARLLAVLMLVMPLTACSSQNNSKDTGKLNIVCTTFPQYDWTRQILGADAEQVELTLLLNNGMDLHNYQMTTDDMVTISTCDMFIYVGGESDAWVKDALKTATNKDMVAIKLLDVLADAVKEEEIKEGMEGDHDDDEDADDALHEEKEYDEHVWLSLKNAQVACSYIAAELGELDPAHAEAYRANAETYIANLASLDQKYKEAVDGAFYNTLLFGDRFPFRYLVDDYGFDYYAAFPGCSAETEASFETIIFLANKVDALGLKHVMVIENSNQSIARTIAQNTNEKNQSILVLNSMQSVNPKDIASGATYLSIMEQNLEIIKEALN